MPVAQTDVFTFEECDASIANHYKLYRAMTNAKSKEEQLRQVNSWLDIRIHLMKEQDGN